MAATYEPIASQTLGSDTSSVSFTSIPGTFTDLVLVASVRTDRAADADNFQLTFNSDTSGNYSFTQIRGSGSTASSGRGSNQTSITSAGITTSNTSAANTFGANVVTIMSYSNTNVYKTLLSEISHAETWGVRRLVGLWRSTSAITSMDITPNAGTNIKAGSTFSLYGIKAA